jgi:uncharacterized coiled-coil protein SlyX
MAVITAQLCLRGGTAAQWAAANPVLALFEQGYESDTQQRKVGDGTTAWDALPYETPITDWVQGPQRRGCFVRDSGELYEVITDRLNGIVAPGPTTTATYRPVRYNDAALVARIATLESTVAAQQQRIADLEARPILTQQTLFDLLEAGTNITIEKTAGGKVRINSAGSAPPTTGAGYVQPGYVQPGYVQSAS